MFGAPLPKKVREAFGVLGGMGGLRRQLDERTREWFAKQRASNTDASKMIADLCGRRAGKSRGGNLRMLRRAASTPGGRFLYINETREEAEKIAWHGAAGDGMHTMAQALGLPVKANASKLTLHFAAIDSWIFLRGADDEAGVRKALGVPYNEVWWDEAQKIPGRLTDTIRNVLMPSLLDRRGPGDGIFRLTGTPVQQLDSLFYDVTRTDGDAIAGWSVHRWNLLDNPHFGVAFLHPRDRRWYVRDPSRGGAIVAGPFDTAEDAQPAVLASRMVAMHDLAAKLGGRAGPLALDDPRMLREGFGLWVHEDALYTYDVHKVGPSSLVYAPGRHRTLDLDVIRLEDGKAVTEKFRIAKFPDIARALRDLPGDWEDYAFAIGADIGFRDPFAVSLVAWNGRDPALYEVATWGAPLLDAPIQAAVLRHFSEAVHVGLICADGGGSVLPTLKGWSAEWVRNYGVPIVEVEKAHKGTAITAANGEIKARLTRFRDDSPVLAEMQRVQWSKLRSGSNRQVESPSIPNDHVDAWLYAHRTSWNHRFTPPAEPLVPGSPEHAAAMERKVLQEAFPDDGQEDDQDGLEVAWIHGGPDADDDAPWY